MINSRRLLDEFIELVKIDSAPREELAIAQATKATLEELGFSVTMDQAGSKIGGNCGNLIARLEGTRQAPTLLFCAHMDRVSPGKGIAPQVTDGVIHSDGTTILAADDVAGIVAIIEGVRAIKEAGLSHGDIEVVFTVAEEGGLYGAKNLACDQLSAEFGYFLDSAGPVGTIVTSAPSQKSIQMTFQGKAAHAGLNPEDGISALVVACNAVAQMKLGRIDEETTANIGVFQAGEATNIVTETALLKGETRSRNKEKLEKQAQHMIDVAKQVAEKFGAQVSVQAVDAYPPFNLTAEDEVVKHAVKAAQHIGLDPKLESTGGGSDANIINGQGIPSVVLGMGYENVHSKKETIPIRELENGARYVYSLIKNA